MSPRDPARAKFGLTCLAISLLAVLFISATADAGPTGLDIDTSDFGQRDYGGGLAIMGIALLAMIALGMPLFVMIGGLAGLSYLLLAEGEIGIETMDVFADESSKMLGKSVLLAIPFFVTSGAIMSAGGIAPRLVEFARACVGWLPGGLAIACVGSCVFFAAISGSSPVTVIAIGSMMYPQLLKAGYDKRFTLGLVTSGGSLGILIPPSIPMLVYAIVAGDQRPIDASELFMAGIVPGLMIGLLLSGYSMLRAGKGTREAFEPKQVWITLKEGFWAISLPVLILGGIYTGVFTATEAAAVSVVYALAVELLIHRDIQVHDLPKILQEAAVTMGAILIIMLMAVTLNHFLVEEKIPDQVVMWIVSMDLSPVSFFIVVNIFLLGVGALMDSISAILIIAPLLAPIGMQLGVDPVHLGIIFIVNLEIGYLTPPIGINLFVASSVFRESMGEVIRGVVPFILLMLVGLGVVTYIPTVSMGLVNVFMRDKPFMQPFPEVPDPNAEPVDQGHGPDGKRVLSIEEMMAQEGADADEDEDETGEDDEDVYGSAYGGGADDDDEEEDLYESAYGSGDKAESGAPDAGEGEDDEEDFYGSAYGGGSAGDDKPEGGTTGDANEPAKPAAPDEEDDFYGSAYGGGSAGATPDGDG
jgi:C4-dicarboxylate transporter DctM subunit